MKPCVSICMAKPPARENDHGMRIKADKEVNRNMSEIAIWLGPSDPA